MFSCQSCLRRCIGSLVSVHTSTAVGSSLALRNARLLHNSPRRRQEPHPQQFSQRDALERSSERDVPDETSGYTDSELSLRPVDSDESFVPDQLEQPPQSDDLEDFPEPGPSKLLGPRWLNWSPARRRKAEMTAVLKTAPRAPSQFTTEQLKRELQFLGDPLRLAANIQNLLRRNDEAKAFAMVHMASKQMICTVSWNHIILHQMDQSRIKDAFSTYNDMKKRAQPPDPYTYAILLQGLAENAHFPLSLGRALSLYHSMTTRQSPVKPSIVHTNTVIKVCCRARDSDAMWGIVSKLPQRGPGAANNYTYTLVLNQLRTTALLDAPEDEEPHATARRREKSVVDGRRIWDDVIMKWRDANLLIDEKLVCTMGRLLLVGARPRDWDDVLSLVEQTMDLPRLVPRLHTIGHPGHIRAPYTPNDMKQPLPAGKYVERYTPGAEFDTLPETRTVGMSGKKASLAYAQPANNTLSLILEACLKTVSRAAAKNYWDLLTDTNTYGIIPDSDNLHMYLRILRQARASTAAVEVVRDEFPRAALTPEAKTFRLAFAACLRDNLNPNAIDNGIALLDLMQLHIDKPDLVALKIFVSLARTAPSPADMLRAIAAAEPSIIDVQSALDGDGEPIDAVEGIALLRLVVSVYDKIRASGELDSTTAEIYQQHVRRLGKIVFEHVDSGAVPARSRHRPGWRRKASQRNEELEQAHGAWEDHGSEVRAIEVDELEHEPRKVKIRRHAMKHQTVRKYAGNEP